MILKQMAVPVLALAMGATGSLAARAAGVQAPPPGYGQAWEVPPQELNALQRQGFHDGIEGARRDAENHRQPNVENRDEYRNPHLPPEQREAYRAGFRRGYSVAMSHLMGGPGMAAPMPIQPPVRNEWNTPPNEFNDIQRQGFRDGMDGAQRDFDNHRTPNVNNRDEYRHPNVPRELRSAYRDGFRRGYNRAMAHLMGRPWQ